MRPRQRQSTGRTTQQTSTGPAGGGPGRRGRPTKFGRPSQVVALTLPQEVLGALRTIHRDPGWAIVQLVERFLGDDAYRPRLRRPREVAELVHLPGARALILVQPQVFERMRDIALIPLADGRAFLAFDKAGGLADLEVAILDRMESEAPTGARRLQMIEARSIVRGWRRDRRLAFRTMRILLAEAVGTAERRLLPALKVDGRGRVRKDRSRRPA